MAREAEYSFSFNRGEVSLLGLGRVDLEHLRLAAQSQINWLPRVLGPMMLRPGSQYVGIVRNNAPTKLISFVAAFNDKALLEMTANVMRVWIDDALVTRPSVTTVIPDFPLWSTVVTGTAQAIKAAGSLEFQHMNTGSSAQAYIAMAIGAGDQNVEHALRFTVTNGPISFAIGSAAGLGDIFESVTVDTGVYSLAFTPGAGTVYVSFSAVQLSDNANTTTQSIPTWYQQVRVTNISIEPPGVLELATPWGATQIGVPGSVPSPLRHDQSADVIFFAAPAIPQYQINRINGPTSWSIVNYRSVKGPMAVVPSNTSITLTAANLYGDTTLTASGNLFRPSDVGTLFRLFSSGQNVIEAISFENTYTDAIEVTGVSFYTAFGSGGPIDVVTPDRDFTVAIVGTWSGTLTLQRSFTGPTTGFVDYVKYTTNQGAVTVTDGQNNEIIWYRVGFDPGDYVSGQAGITISYPGGGNYGVAHVLSYVSPTVVNVEVLVPFWGTAPTSDWLQSEWSSSQGYPTSVAIHEGRLWWAGADKWWGSVSDDYSNFDFDAVGDSAPIDQSIGAGPIANINWLVSIDHLLAGADTSIVTALSDAIESPLTPSNFTLRRSVTNGSYQIQGAPVDQRVVYVDQSGRKLYALIYDIRLYNYKPTELTRLNPDIGLPGFTAMAVQRQPDTRINLIRTDGILVSLIYDDDDDVEAFWRVQTQGAYEDIAVLPGTREDQVYTVVNRTIGGQTVRYLEKFARIDECQGAAICKNLDAHLVYQGAATNVLGGFTHLIGQTVAIWGQTSGPDSFIGDLGTAVVSASGTVTIPNGLLVTAAVAGLPYAAEFISAKLEYAAKMGSAVNRPKRIDHIGFSFVATHCQGVRYGPWTPNNPLNTANGIFTTPPVLDPMPVYEYGAPVSPNTVWAQYDAKQIEFGCDFDTDIRLYLQAASPRPATIIGVTFAIETSG